ncbi:hypothetical protein DIC82_15845 [Clostridium beijerinckii]|nr:hypothetical protein DIC82_15845 [Clostridium beijerinckii]
MTYLGLLDIKLKILVRKVLLNILLIIFSTRNKYIVALSQNLDKHIVLYQKELLLFYFYDNTNKFVK